MLTDVISVVSTFIAHKVFILLGAVNTVVVCLKVDNPILDRTVTKVSFHIFHYVSLTLLIHSVGSKSTFCGFYVFYVFLFSGSPCFCAWSYTIHTFVNMIAYQLLVRISPNLKLRRSCSQRWWTDYIFRSKGQLWSTLWQQQTWSKITCLEMHLSSRQFAIEDCLVLDTFSRQKSVFIL